MNAKPPRDTTAPPDPLSPADKPRRGRWRRPLAIAIVLLAAFVLALVLAGPSLLRPLLRHRLQQMVSAQLNAELQIDHLAYHFPYGIEISGATLVANGPDGKPLALVRIPQFELSLARLPTSAGPLVIS